QARRPEPGDRAVRRLGLTLLAMWLAVASAWANSVAGMLTDLKGQVEVQAPGGKWAAGKLLGMLEPGARVRLGAGASATVCLTQGGTRARLTGPCEVELSGGSLKLASGAAGAMKLETPLQSGGVAMPAGVNLDKMGGVLRSAGDDPDPPQVLWTMDPAVWRLDPPLTWRAAGGFQSYEVEITDLASMKVIFKTSRPGDSREASLPEGNRLTYGNSYSLVVTGLGGDGGMEVDTLVVRVLPEKEATSLQQLTKQAWETYRKHPEDVTPLSLLLATLLEKQLFEPAVEVGRELVKARPGQPEVRALLAHLLRMKGRSEEAGQVETGP
ncbi:MAG: hypothetical protein AB1758_35560, partial [Candidatus Eremiobacterota bacterium]